MPQLSFDKATEVHSVTITLRLDEIRQVGAVQLMAFNKEGTLLASGGVAYKGMEEAELVPILLHSVGFGWLYRGIEDTILKPLQTFRAQRKSLDRAAYHGHKF
jgi:hypothetical protein